MAARPSTPLTRHSLVPPGCPPPFRRGGTRRTLSFGTPHGGKEIARHRFLRRKDTRSPVEKWEDRIARRNEYIALALRLFELLDELLAGTGPLPLSTWSSSCVCFSYHEGGFPGEDPYSSDEEEVYVREAALRSRGYR